MKINSASVSIVKEGHEELRGLVSIGITEGKEFKEMFSMKEKR